MSVTCSHGPLGQVGEMVMESHEKNLRIKVGNHVCYFDFRLPDLKKMSFCFPFLYIFFDLIIYSP